MKSKLLAILVMSVSLLILLSACSGEESTEVIDWGDFVPYDKIVVDNGYKCGELQVIGVGTPLNGLKLESNGVSYLELVGEVAPETLISFQDVLDSLDLPDC